MQFSVSGSLSLFLRLQPLTDNCFQYNKKGNLFSRKGPYLPGKIGPRGAHFTRRMGLGAPNEGGPQNFMTQAMLNLYSCCMR